jgi:hypothetical protein
MLSPTLRIRQVADFEVKSYQPAQTFERCNSLETGTANAIGFNNVSTRLFLYSLTPVLKDNFFDN